MRKKINAEVMENHNRVTVKITEIHQVLPKNNIYLRFFYLGCFWEDGVCYEKVGECNGHRYETLCNSENNQIPGGFISFICIILKKKLIPTTSGQAVSGRMMFVI
jgi:hypothetical protein